MAHTQGPWRRGKCGGSVVADHPVPEIGGSDAVDYYGGHLIAESIAPQNVPIIEAAPDMLAMLHEIAANDPNPHPNSIAGERLARIRAIIAKAEAP